MAEQIEEASGAQTPEPLSHADDVRNDVAEALKALKTKEEPDETPETEIAEEPEPLAASDDRPRGPDGKFLPKEKQAGAPEKAAPETIAPTTDDVAKPSIEQPSTAAVAAPGRWSADAKAMWASLPPAVQAAVAKAEQEMDTGGRQWSEEKKRYQATLAPLVQETQRLGVTPEQGLNSLLAAHRMLQQNPAAALSHLAQQYGVDLANLASNPPAEQPRFDPMVSQLTQHVSTLEAQLNGFLQNQTMGVVERFAADHPHYAAVEDHIATLIPIIQQREPGLSPSDVLTKAYDQAIWLNPDVRSKLIEEQTKPQQQVQAVQAKAQKAAKAAVSVKGSSNGAAPAPKVQGNSGGDVYDDVRSAINQLRMQ